MGWKRKIAGKLGSLLYRPLDTAAKPDHLQGPAGPSGESKEAIQDPSQELQPNSREATEQREEFGPDTSSLTAFLLSFLRNSEASDNRTDHGPNLEAFEESRDDLGGASSSEGWVGQNECEVDGFSMGSPHVGCWGNVDKHASKMNKDSDLLVQRLGENQSSVIQGRQCHSLMLPAMSENSVLLSDDIRTVIYPALPNLIKGCIWMLLYSTARHGISLHTLYRRSAALPGPVLLVVGDFQGAVFGGLVTAPLKPTSKRKYHGTTEMFVFTNVHATPRYFMATGTNRYFCLCNNTSIAIGGGGHFALLLDEDLLHGSSGACDTFGSYCLANAEEFPVANVEVWGFAHTSRCATLLRELQGPIRSEWW